MKVWTVTHDDMDQGNRLLGVFTSKAKAEDHLNGVYYEDRPNCYITD